MYEDQHRKDLSTHIENHSHRVIIYSRHPVNKSISFTGSVLNISTVLK